MRSQQGQGGGEKSAFSKNWRNYLYVDMFNIPLVCWSNVLATSASPRSGPAAAGERVVTGGQHHSPNSPGRSITPGFFLQHFLFMLSH